MAMSDGTPDPSAYGAALSQPGYGYGTPLLLPQVAQAYQNDPRTALVRELMRQNSEGLKSFMPSGKAVAGHVIASGLGALAAALQGQRYQDINDQTMKGMQGALNTATGPAPANGQADPYVMARALAGNAATLPQAMQMVGGIQQENYKASIADRLKLAEQGKKRLPDGSVVTETGATDAEKALALAKATGTRTGENIADTSPTNIEGQAALTSAKTTAGTTAEINAKTNPTAIAGQANLAGGIAGSEAKAKAPYETVDVPPGGVVMPKSAIVGGGAPRARIAPGVPLPPPPGPSPQVPPIAAGPAGPTSMSTTPPPPVDQSVISPPASAGSSVPGPSATPNLVKLPMGGFANTATPLQINNTSITGGNKLAETSADLDAKEVAAAREDSQASIKGAQSAQMIKDFMPNVKMGWNGERLTQAGEILKTLGVSDKSITDLLHTNVADAQVLNTKFLDLAVSGIKGTGVQRPGSVLPTFLGRYPNLGTEPDAASMLANATIMDSKYKTDYADGKDARRQESMVGAQQPGSAYKGLTGFDKDFRTSNPPLYYVHAAEAMSGKDVGWKQVTDDAQRAKVIGLMPSGTHFLLPQPITGPNGETISWGVKQ